MFTTRVTMPENFYYDNLPCFHTLCHLNTTALPYI